MAIDYFKAKSHQRKIAKLTPGQTVIVRRDVTGYLFTATVLRDDGGDSIKVQPRNEQWPTYPHHTQIVEVLS